MSASLNVDTVANQSFGNTFRGQDIRPVVRAELRNGGNKAVLFSPREAVCKITDGKGEDWNEDGRVVTLKTRNGERHIPIETPSL